MAVNVPGRRARATASLTSASVSPPPRVLTGVSVWKSIISDTQKREVLRTHDIRACRKESSLASQDRKHRIGVLIQLAHGIDCLLQQLAAECIERLWPIKLSNPLIGGYPPLESARTYSNDADSARDLDFNVLIICLDHFVYALRLPMTLI